MKWVFGNSLIYQYWDQYPFWYSCHYSLINRVIIMNDYVVYYFNSEMEMVTDHYSANTVQEVLDYYYSQDDVCEVDNVELVD